MGLFADPRGNLSPLPLSVYLMVHLEHLGSIALGI